MIGKRNNCNSMGLLIAISLCFLALARAELFVGDACELKDGSLGVCRAISRCKWAIAGLQANNNFYSTLVRCKFIGSEEIVCCADEKPMIQSTSERTIPNGDKDTIFFATSQEADINLDDLINSIFNFTTNGSLNEINMTDELKLTTVSTTSIKFNDDNDYENIWIDRRTTTKRPRNPWESGSDESYDSNSILHPIRTTTPRYSNEVPDYSNNPFLRNVATTTTRRPTWDFPTTTVRPRVTTTVRTTPTTTWWTTTRPTTRTTIRTTPWTTARTTIRTTPWTTARTTTRWPTERPTTLPSWMQDVINEFATTTRRTNTGAGNNLDLFTGGSGNEFQFSTPRTSSSTSPPSRLSVRKSEAACDRFVKMSFPMLSFHILGGIDADEGEFPHMAALGQLVEEAGNNATYNWFCGGTLISDRFVLTAAHCTYRPESRPTVIRMGTVLLNSPANSENRQDFGVAEILNHPEYRSNRKYHDISLIRLDRNAVLNDYVRPACLANTTAEIGEDVELIITGWGSTSTEQRRASNSLLKANLTSVELGRCNQSLWDYNPRDRTLPTGLMQGQMCAFDAGLKKDACQGDSGGPMQMAYINGSYIVVGVTSFGIECGVAYPSVYSRVAFYLDWIESIVWPDT